MLPAGRAADLLQSGVLCMPVHVMICARCEAVWSGGCPGAVLQKVEAATLLQATGLSPAGVLDLL